MAQFVTNPAIRERMQRRVADATRRAADVMVSAVHNTIQDGSEEDRSSPGEPPRSQSGELENSVKVLQFESSSTSANARIGTTLIKGWWLEFGTAVMAPRPWLRPSFQRSEPDMLSEYRNIANE